MPDVPTIYLKFFVAFQYFNLALGLKHKMTQEGFVVRRDNVSYVRTEHTLQPLKAIFCLNKSLFAEATTLKDNLGGWGNSGESESYIVSQEWLYVKCWLLITKCQRWCQKRRETVRWALLPAAMEVRTCTRWSSWNRTVMSCVDINHTISPLPPQVPFTTMLALLCMWFGISMPLVYLGYYFGFRKQPYDNPVRTNQIPRQVPEQRWYMNKFVGWVSLSSLPTALQQSMYTRLFV